MRMLRRLGIFRRILLLVYTEATDPNGGGSNMPALSYLTVEKKKIILEEAIGRAEESVYRFCMYAGIDPLTLGDELIVDENSSEFDLRISKELERMSFLKAELGKLSS